MLYEAQIKKAEEELDKAIEQFEEEVGIGNPDVGRRRGRGPVAEQFKILENERREDFENIKNEQTPNIQSIDRQISDINIAKAQELEERKISLDNSDDILTQLNAFQSLQEKEEKIVFDMGYIGLAGFGINLFFIALDGTAITLRLFSSRTTYDELLEEFNDDNLKEAHEKKEIQKDIRKKLQDFEKQQIQRELEIKTNEFEQEQSFEQERLDQEYNFKRERNQRRIDARKILEDKKLSNEIELSEKQLDKKITYDNTFSDSIIELDEEYRSKAFEILKEYFDQYYKSEFSPRSQGLDLKVRNKLTEIISKGILDDAFLISLSNEINRNNKAPFTKITNDFSDLWESLTTQKPNLKKNSQRQKFKTTKIISKRTKNIKKIGNEQVWNFLSQEFSLRELGQAISNRCVTPLINIKGKWSSFGIKKKVMFLLGASFAIPSFWIGLELLIVIRKYDLRFIPYPQNINSPIILDSTGQEIPHVYSYALKEEKEVSDFSKNLVDALIVSEDRRFYKHNGIDFQGILRAFYQTVFQRNRQGASTLTQQVAKKLYLEREDTFIPNQNHGNKSEGFLSNTISSNRKKIQQMLLALLIERRYSKEEILKIYLNRIYIGEEYYSSDLCDNSDRGRIYGFEEASQIYFSKSALELDIAESALLISLLPQPNSIEANPLIEKRKSCSKFPVSTNQEVWSVVVEDEQSPQKLRRNLRIQQLEIMGKISLDESALAQSQPIKISLGQKQIPPWTEAPQTEADFQQVVRRELLEILTTIKRNPNRHYIIETTLERGQQAQAQAVLETHLRSKGVPRGYQYASLVSLNTQSGAILALVDGTRSRDLQGRIDAHEQFSSKNMNRRLASTFKLFTFTAAIRQGISIDQEYSCTPDDMNKMPEQIKEECSSDKLPMSMREGFAESNNLIAWLVAQEVAEEEIFQLAEDAGIEKVYSQFKEYEEKPDQQKTFTMLGLTQSNLLDITNAYSTIANGGIINKPYAIQTIRDANKCEDEDNFSTCEIIYERKSSSKQLLSNSIAVQVRELLEAVVIEGLAKEELSDFMNKHPSKRVAGKTGTSSDNRDMWFIASIFDENPTISESNITTGVWLSSCAVPSPSQEEETVFNPYSNTENCITRNGTSRFAVELWKEYADSILQSE